MYTLCVHGESMSQLNGLCASNGIVTSFVHRIEPDRSFLCHSERRSGDGHPT